MGSDLSQVENVNPFEHVHLDIGGIAIQLLSRPGKSKNSVGPVWKGAWRRTEIKFLENLGQAGDLSATWRRFKIRRSSAFDML